jgi:cellulose synthase/poly-beta-1,6-N-acetylglucosamine synthase-like glycosyltransferase
MIFSVIITSYKEPTTIQEAISQILEPNLGFFSKNAELIITAPDEETLNAADKAINKYNLQNYKLIKDKGIGKPAALNLAAQSAKGRILFFTDGDMYISENAISEMLPLFNDEEVGGVSGHPVSLDARTNMFGYFSHLFCEAAHKKRTKEPETPMSGYLYAVRNIPSLFPIPEEMRAEDAYLSVKIKSMGFKTAYAPEAFAFVYFPKSLDDWLKQKKRSLGGNVQMSKFTAKSPQNHRKARSLGEDLQMMFFPLTFAANLTELIYSIALYPLRLYLWVLIYRIHWQNKYKSGMWDRIETSKY